MAVDGNKFGATITVVSSNVSYNTYTDCGLIVTEGDPIGDPEQERNYINVPGRPNLLDASEALTGGPVFKGRRIDIPVAITGRPDAWTTTVSRIRNAIDGRQVKVVFDDDPSHYWLGRCKIQNTSRIKRLGRFNITFYVDAYKYEIASSQEQLRWDDMNFLTDCLRYLGEITVTNSYTLVIPAGDHAVVPTIKIRNMTSQTLTMSVVGAGTAYTLVSGTNRFPELKVCGDSDVTLSFSGSAKVKFEYRGESL